MEVERSQALIEVRLSDFKYFLVVIAIVHANNDGNIFSKSFADKGNSTLSIEMATSS